MEKVRNARAILTRPEEGAVPQRPPVESESEGAPIDDTRDESGRVGDDVQGESESGAGTARVEPDGVGVDAGPRTPVADEPESDVSDMDDGSGDITPESVTPEDSDEVPDINTVGSRDTGSTDTRGDERGADPTEWSEVDDTEPGGSPDIHPGESVRVEPNELDELVEAVYQAIVEGTPLSQ